jgi:hypothetical protein
MNSISARRRLLSVKSRVRRFISEMRLSSWASMLSSLAMAVRRTSSFFW